MMNKGDEGISAGRPGGLYGAITRSGWLYRLARAGAAGWRSCVSAMERVRGLDFTSWNDRESLGFSDSERHGYQAWPTRITRRVLSAMRIGEGDAILDIGCGKGNALRTFARHPFRAIAGVDCSPALCQIARRNMERLGLSARVAVYEGDATSFPHYDRFNVFFLFNPFGRETLRSVLLRIEESCPAGERRRLIYANPVYEAEIYDLGGQREFAVRDPLRPAVHVYRLRAGGAGS